MLVYFKSTTYRPLFGGLRKTSTRYYSVVCHPTILANFHFLFSHQLTVLPDETTIIYSFWNGMPYPTQVHILKLSAGCRTVHTLAVFRDDKWSLPDEGYFRINALDCFFFSLHTCGPFDLMLRQWLKNSMRILRMGSGLYFGL